MLLTYSLLWDVMGIQGVDPVDPGVFLVICDMSTWVKHGRILSTDVVYCSKQLYCGTPMLTHSKMDQWRYDCHTNYTIFNRFFVKDMTFHMVPIVVGANGATHVI